MCREYSAHIRLGTQLSSNEDRCFFAVRTDFGTRSIVPTKRHFQREFDDSTHGRINSCNFISKWVDGFNVRGRQYVSLFFLLVLFGHQKTLTE